MHEPGLQRARLRASQDHFTRARRHVANRPARGGGRRIQARRRTESRQPRHRGRARANAESAARASGDQSRRQDRARGACRAHERSALAWSRRACRAVARRAQLPRREQSDVIIRALAQMSKVNVVFDPAFRPTPISIEIRNQTFDRGAAVDHREHAEFLSRHGAAHDHDHPRHPRQAAGVRGRHRPHVLSQQRRSQRDDGSAAHRDRRAQNRRHAGHERHHDHRHGGARRGGRPSHQHDRQGASRSAHRRRAARGEPDPARRIRAAVRVAGNSTGINGIADVNKSRPHAATT